MISELLADEHLDVITLRQGPAILGLVKSIRPDLILLDNEMSASSGESIRVALKQDEGTQTIPLVLCSSADGDRLRKRVRRYRTSGCTGKGDARRPGNVIAKYLAGSGP
jgi:CheY-like chemotaxis protein